MLKACWYKVLGPNIEIMLSGEGLFPTGFAVSVCFQLKGLKLNNEPHFLNLDI